MVNPDDSSISIFRTSTNELAARVTTGAEPSAVVLHPDSKTAFVANRADATVVRVANIDGSTPSVTHVVPVGSEPTALALSPTGARLFVAEWAEGRVTVIDTVTMTIEATIDAPHNPRAVAVTNNGNTNDSDETLVVTEYFGEPNADPMCPGGNSEACDTGRRGRIRLYNLADLTPQNPIILQPLDSGFAPTGSAPGTATVMTAPNQLYAAAILGTKVYVTSVSASPQPPIRFNTNVFPVVYVGDLTTHMEDRSAIGTANLARLVENVVPDGPGTDRFFLQDIVDLAFWGDSNVAYVVSRAADVVQRVQFEASSGITVGTDAVRQIDLTPACQNPTGIAVSDVLNRAYVNCWITRRLGIINIDTQALTTTVQSTPLPPAGSPADSLRKGARFFFTGRGRWSDEGEGYSACASCHPDGLSDNITWSFAAGPRQTTAMDATFSKGDGPQQRVLNWTGIFDELHDFERNTRGVSGGLGAITTSATNECGTVTAEQQVTISADGLGQPVKEVQDTTPGICVKDWDDINNFVKTIRPPRGLRNLDPTSVARGGTLFGAGNGECAKCHAGPSWTVSRQFWTPSSATNALLKTMPFIPPTGDTFWPIHPLQISSQPPEADTTDNPIGPNEVACVLRNVGTFGVTDDDTTTDALERKADGTRAQGRGGFNVPSLWGLAVGAPYFHHGQAASLSELLADAKWASHLKAGNPSFNPTAQERQDLANYLLSIDTTTPPRPVPENYDACPIEVQATLSGQDEVPAVSTAGKGSATILLTPTEVNVILNTEGMSNVILAHIHIGPAGVSGPVMFGLYDSQTDGAFPAQLIKKITPADLQLQPQLGITSFADAIDAIRSGNAYINVHTNANPNGEIRGQLATTVLQATLNGQTYVNIHTAAHQGGEIRGQIGATEFHTDLSGENQPSPVSTTARGRASVGLTSSTITATLNTQGLTNAILAHIHAGPVGRDGPVILPLYNNATDGTLASPFTVTLTSANLLPNSAAGIDTFADALNAIKSGNAYVNIHTVANPGGEIRGQLAATELHATLNGENEPEHVDTTASGRASIGLTPSAITVTLSTRDLTNALLAHIHAGGLNASGPVVFPLYDSTTDGSLPSLFTTILTSAAFIPVPGISSFADALIAIRGGSTYVNVHTTAYPNGEIRGPIGVTELHATLSGEHETSPVTTTASGRADVFIRSTVGRSPDGGADPPLIPITFVTIQLLVHDLTNPLLAHVHLGPVGQDGPVIIPLYSSAMDGPLRHF